MYDHPTAILVDFAHKYTIDQRRDVPWNRSTTLPSESCCCGLLYHRLLCVGLRVHEGVAFAGLVLEVVFVERLLAARATTPRLAGLTSGPVQLCSRSAIDGKKAFDKHGNGLSEAGRTYFGYTMFPDKK